MLNHQTPGGGSCDPGCKGLLAMSSYLGNCEGAERELLRDWVVIKLQDQGMHMVWFSSHLHVHWLPAQNPNCGDAVELLHLAARIPARSTSDVQRSTRGKRKKRGRQRRVARRNLEGCSVDGAQRARWWVRGRRR